MKSSDASSYLALSRSPRRKSASPSVWSKACLSQTSSQCLYIFMITMKQVGDPAGLGDTCDKGETRRDPLSNSAGFDYQTAKVLQSINSSCPPVFAFLASFEHKADKKVIHESFCLTKYKQEDTFHLLSAVWT